MKECQVVQDLLPLYLDGEVQDGTTIFIKKHLETCVECQRLKDFALNNDSVQSQLKMGFADLEENNLPGSPEKFMLKLKKRRRSFIGLFLIGILILGLGIGMVSHYVTSQSYAKKQQAEIQFFKEQLVALEEVSPGSKSIMDTLGITFKSKAVGMYGDRLLVEYSFTWSEDSPVDYIVQDSHWFNEPSIVDGKSGVTLPLSGGRSSSDGYGLRGEVTAHLPSAWPERIIYKTRTVYAFLEEYGPKVTIPFDYEGGDKTIPVNKEFSYRGIDFKINNIELTKEKVIIDYEQLTPAQEVGVYQLAFELDDRLGNVWSNSPEIELLTGNPRRFSMNTPHSLAKHWNLNVKHVVQVIPGVSENLTLNGGGQK